MAGIKVSTTLNAAPEVVWQDVEDISSHPEWMADAVGIRFLTEQTSGVGTRFECATKVGPFRLNDVMEITEWDPPKAMGVVHKGLVTGTGRFTLDAQWGNRTRFQWKEELSFPLWLGGPIGALASTPVLSWVWRRSMRNLQRRF